MQFRAAYAGKRPCGQAARKHRLVARNRADGAEDRGQHQQLRDGGRQIPRRWAVRAKLGRPGAVVRPSAGPRSCSERAGCWRNVRWVLPMACGACGVCPACPAYPMWAAAANGSRATPDGFSSCTTAPAAAPCLDSQHALLCSPASRLRGSSQSADATSFHVELHLPALSDLAALLRLAGLFAGAVGPDTASRTSTGSRWSSRLPAGIGRRRRPTSSCECSTNHPARQD